MRPRALAAALAAVALVAAIIASGASAEVQTIDFEAATLGAPLNGEGDIAFPQSRGFRPYGAEVGNRANSGTKVGDLGRCIEEAPRASACELFQAHTTAELARTASSVTVFVGRFGPIEAGDVPERAMLTAFRADGQPIAAQAIELVEGFKRRLQVQSPAGNIAGFSISAISGADNSGPAGDLGVDDVSVNFVQGGAADFAVSTTTDVVGVPAGEEVQVPVRVSRINGSNGRIDLAVSGLPLGVSADPVRLEGLQTQATLTLRAEPSAPDTNFAPAAASVVANPNGNAAVAPAPRTAPLAVRVGRAFQLRSGEVTDAEEKVIPVSLPSCAAVDVPLTIARDPALERTVQLSVRQDLEDSTLMPPGISGEFLAGADVAPGGGLVAERTLRLRSDASSGLFSQPRTIVVEARVEPGEPPRALRLRLTHAEGASVSRITPAFRDARTPRFGRPGATVRVSGEGFCPGTTVIVGSDQSRTPTTLLDDRTLEFVVPRYATTGPLTVVPPAGGHPYQGGRLQVDSVRNGDAFPFKNYPFGALALDELERAFGSDDIFISVNPCWPFANCTVQTGFLSPMAAIDWGVLNIALRRSNGHCFGINLSLQQLASRKVPLSFYTRAPGAQPFDVPGPNGPEASLEALLDANHARQYSEEFLEAYFKRPKGLQPQLDLLAREFGKGQMPMVQIYRGLRAHSVLAYDLVETASTARIYVYDNASPFLAEEEFDPNRHRTKVEAGVIAIDKTSGTWTYEGASGWSGSVADGSIWVSPFEANPDDPSLPGRDTLTRGLAYVVLGSLDGTVRSDAGSGAEFLPDTGEEADAAGNGTWVGAAGKPLDVTMTGTRDGRYTQAYSAPGFIASIEDVATKKGVRDEITGAGDELRFESGRARELEIGLAKEQGKTLTLGATLRIHASAGGAERAGFAKSGALTFAHEGAATAASFTLTAIRPNGGPTSFESGPVALRDGDRVTAKPLGRDLKRVRLTIRGKGGRKVSRVLRDRSNGGRLRIGKPRVSKGTLSLPYKLSGVRGRGRGIVGASLRLMRGKRVVAKKALAVRASKGAHRITWKLPKGISRGSYRLAADLRALSPGSRGSTVTDSVTAASSSRLKISRR
ncbi:MAG TPA: hypothetical protein VFX45_06665 [Solirubrobacterales bacterium]|nr:hypothetical protein [Solirubrobacterales bacterium]